jgi:hypothetical protein
MNSILFPAKVIPLERKRERKKERKKGRKGTLRRIKNSKVFVAEDIEPKLKVPRQFRKESHQ